MSKQNVFDQTKQNMQRQGTVEKYRKQKDDETPRQNYYRPAEIETGCISSTYHLRFPQLINSFITKGFFAAMAAFIKWRTQYENKGIPQDLEQLQRKLPINKNPEFKCPPNKIRYTWIGHSTAVIGIGGNANLIIDPVFSERCSPFQFVGPKRFRDPACQIAQLPQIDLVLVSHDHYDHLDQHSLNQLYRRFKPQFVAGLRSDDSLPKGSTFILMDWTQTVQIKINGLIYEVTFVPVCHWSRRGMFDQGKRLWGGFVIKTPKGKKIFYPGDTGYCDIFKQLGDIFGGFDLCIIPIGAYQPRQLLKAQHFNPQDAVIVHKQLKSKKSVGVHWGTFPLGWQHWCGARDDLKQAAKKHGLREDQFITVGHGDSFEIDY